MPLVCPAREDATMRPGHRPLLARMRSLVAASHVLLVVACTSSPSPRATATPLPATTPTTVAVATSAPIPTPAPAQPTPVVSPTPAGPSTDTTLAGQTRYIAKTDGIGIKVRAACDDRTGSGGWPEGDRVVVEYARSD